MTRPDSYTAGSVMGGLVLAVVLLLAIGALCRAANAANVVIPEVPPVYRIQLEREAVRRFGVQAPIARIAAQIHQESRWRPTAASAYAQGLAQFTPPTVQWLPTVCPDIGRPDPWDASWSLRAIVCYDAWLYARMRGATECDRWAFALSGYNGGPAWIDRDKAEASRNGLDPLRWFGHVERTTRRAAAHAQENRGYVYRILRLLEPAYIAAGWSGRSVCR